MDAATRMTLAKQADEEIQQVIGKWREVLAPEKDLVTGEWCVHDEEHEDCTCPLPDTVVLTEYVLVMNWTDLAGKDIDDDVVTQHARFGLKRTHVIGLLQGAQDYLRGI